MVAQQFDGLEMGVEERLAGRIGVDEHGPAAAFQRTARFPKPGVEVAPVVRGVSGGDKVKRLVFKGELLGRGLGDLDIAQALLTRRLRHRRSNRLLCVVLRTCTVAVKDLRDVEHSIEVTAETLYEAIATALAALQKDNWVGEIGQGFATVTVVVQQPPVKHEVKMKDFVSWLGREGRSPAEVMLKQSWRIILGKANRTRT